MKRSLSLAACLTAAVLVVASTAEATPRHKREPQHKPMAGKPLHPEIGKLLKAMAAQAKGRCAGWKLGSWFEGVNEVEVLVSFPFSPPIEVVFKRKDRNAPWYLAGYEYPVAINALTPPARCALANQHPKGTIKEVEQLYSAAWGFLGFQVTIDNGGKLVEVFIRADGTIIPDPL
jgi:hypothetical protein